MKTLQEQVISSINEMFVAYPEVDMFFESLLAKERNRKVSKANISNLKDLLLVVSPKLECNKLPVSLIAYCLSKCLGTTSIFTDDVKNKIKTYIKNESKKEQQYNNSARSRIKK